MKRAAPRTQDWSNPKSSSPSYNIPGGFQLRKFLISGTCFLHRCYFYILGLAKGTAAKQGSQLRGQIPECSVLPWTFLGMKANSSLAMKVWGALKQVLALSLVYNSEFSNLSQEHWGRWGSAETNGQVGAAGFVRHWGRSQLCASPAFWVFCTILCAMYSSLNQYLVCCEGRGRPSSLFNSKNQNFMCHTGIREELRFGETALHRFAEFWAVPQLLPGVSSAGFCWQVWGRTLCVPCTHSPINNWCLCWEESWMIHRTQNAAAAWL